MFVARFMKMSTRFLLLLILHLSVSSCAVLDGVDMMTMRADWTDIVTKNPHSIQVQQRYSPEYYSPRKSSGWISAVLSTSGRRVRPRAYYKLIGASFDTYKAFDLNVTYKCPSYEFTDYLSFSKDTLSQEIRGGALERGGPCTDGPYKAKIIISSYDFYGSTYDKKSKTTRMGLFKSGIFREGMKKWGNGGISFLKYNESGKMNGEQIFLFPDGGISITNFIDGQISGDRFYEMPSGKQGYDHNLNGTDDTAQYYEQVANRRTNQAFDKEVKAKTAKLTKSIEVLQTRLKVKEKIVSSHKFKTLKENIKQHGFKWRDCKPYIPLVLSRYAKNEAEKNLWARQKKRAAEKRAATKKICLAMNEFVNDIEFGDISSMDDFMGKVDLSKLSERKYSALVKGIKAYREIQQRKPILIEKIKKKDDMVERIRQKQKFRRQQENTKHKAAIKAEKLKAANERMKWKDATRKCWDAYGFGPYSEWKAYPEAEPCNGDVEVRKYL